VSDLVDALLMVAFDGNASGRVFNIGNPHEVTMLELAQLVSDAAGGDGTIEFSPPAADDPARRRPDIYRMIERYGWQPRVDLTEGLRRTVAAFRGEGRENSTLVAEVA
jgi:nucleoside-diphosphate-sugar epimerase